MEYKQVMEYVSSLTNPKEATSLLREEKILLLIGNPQNSLNVIHIAGTNGKGSTASMVASALACSGFKTGLFVSPFVTDFRERIQINSCMISKDDFSEYAQRIMKIANSNNITLGHFDFITAVAFNYFKDRKCDYVVLETGLGGRYDATNAVKKPICCAITKISLDHTGILGNTIEKITYEKAGIIKKDVPLFTCNKDPRALRIIKETAEKFHSLLTVTNVSDVSDVNVNLDGTSFSYKNHIYTLGLIGKHQIENSLMAIEILKFLGVKEHDIQNGLKLVKHPGRLEVAAKNPILILDGAHNADGASALAEFLNCISFCGTVIFGAMADKDVKSVVDSIYPFAKRFIAVTVNNKRALKAEEIAKLKKNIEICESLDMALKKVSGDNVLICGSLYLVSEFKKSGHLNNL